MVLPEECFFWIHRKVTEAFEMYFNYKNLGLKPWEYKGKYLVEDIQVLNMMEQLMHDRQVYAERKRKNDNEVQQTIEKFKQENKPKSKKR